MLQSHIELMFYEFLTHERGCKQKDQTIICIVIQGDKIIFALKFNIDKHFSILKFIFVLYGKYIIGMEMFHLPITAENSFFFLKTPFSIIKTSLTEQKRKTAFIP